MSGPAGCAPLIAAQYEFDRAIFGLWPQSPVVGARRGGTSRCCVLVTVAVSPKAEQPAICNGTTHWAGGGETKVTKEKQKGSGGPLSAEHGIPTADAVPAASTIIIPADLGQKTRDAEKSMLASRRRSICSALPWVGCMVP